MSIHDIKASFNPALLSKILPFKAENDIRYYLNGVLVEKAEKGVYLVASDGHCMAVAHDADGTLEGADQVIISVSKGLAAAAKSAKSIAGIEQKVLLTGRRVRMAVDFDSTGALESFVQPGNSQVEGRFPNWRKVAPDFDKLKRGAFTGAEGVNAVYLARCAKLGSRKLSALSFWQEEPCKPVVIQSVGAPEVMVIIAVMRGESDELQRSQFAPFRTAKTTASELVTEAA